MMKLIVLLLLVLTASLSSLPKATAAVAKGEYKTLDMSEFRKVSTPIAGSKFGPGVTCTTRTGLVLNATDHGYNSCLADFEDAKTNRSLQGQRKDGPPANSLGYSVKQN